MEHQIDNTAVSNTDMLTTPDKRETELIRKILALRKVLDRINGSDSRKTIDGLHADQVRANIVQTDG